MPIGAGRDRLQEASRDGGRTRRKAYGLTVPVVYVPNHEVVGLSVVGLRTPLPKMRWGVWLPRGQVSDGTGWPPVDVTPE